MRRHVLCSALVVATLTLAVCSSACVQTQGQDAHSPAAHALADLRASAEAGDAEAQFILGGMYVTGVGVPQDDVAAVAWYRRAAEQGHARAVVLSHSRLLGLCFYRRQTMAVLTDGLERAFARFGGVPKELLFDQMRAVVLSDQRVGGGELVLNAEFLRVAAHWGFHPRACRPYRAQTKGKVERPIRYIRDSFFYGRAFANDEDLNEQASRWLEGTANVRRHGTTGERPVRAVSTPLRQPDSAFTVAPQAGDERGRAIVTDGL